ncbi:MAG: anti-sigma factor [Pararobbsia sp.]
MARFDRPVEPPAAIWLAIESRLDLAAATRGGFDAPQPGMPAANTRRRPGRGWDTLGFWRGLSGVALAVAIVSIGIALRTAAPAAPAGVPVAPRIGYVSVLHDDRSNSTLLVTWDDAHSTVTLQRLSDVPVPGGHDLQLWGIASSGPPASLGVLPKQGAASFKVAYRPQNYGVLAISVEPAGGSPNPNGPTGPLIYTGKLVPTS